MLFAFTNCRVQKFCTPWHLIMSLRTLACSHKNICCLPGLDFYHPAFWVCSLCSLCLFFESACIVNTPVAMTTPQVALMNHLVAGFIYQFFKKALWQIWSDAWWLFHLLIELLHWNYKLWPMSVVNVSHIHSLSLCVAFNLILIDFDFNADFFCSDIFFDR